MRRSRDLRAAFVHRLFARQASYSTDDSSLRSLLASLEAIPRPSGYQEGDDLHMLVADANTNVTVRLEYEKRELLRDCHFLAGGMTALLEVLRCQHDKMMQTAINWLEPSMPSWSDCIERAMIVMRVASTADHRQERHSCKPFQNLIADRDGTTNNYCDRYASSVQSAYNAVWLSEFAQICTENSILLTAAPLGGRPSADGLLELCTMPDVNITYAGSKGREYLDRSTKEVVKVEPLPHDVGELLDVLHQRLAALCLRPGNTKFACLGSGLQHKCGELTMAHNDPACNVSDFESNRFKAEVRHLVDEMDPLGKVLELQCTATDIEISTRSTHSGPSFNKSNGVMCLDSRLCLNVAEGPNLVCGDTPSDLPMLRATLDLMTKPCDEHDTIRLASKLAVLFIISPDQHTRTPYLASEVCALCAAHGAHCAILPSPDVLMAAMARFTQEVANGATLASRVGQHVPTRSTPMSCTL
jgi:hypothetical protein